MEEEPKACDEEVADTFWKETNGRVAYQGGLIQEMNDRCRDRVKRLHTDLIGAHGPPLAQDVKGVMCNPPCSDLDRVMSELHYMSGCGCDQTTSAKPNTCYYNSATHLYKEVGLLTTVEAYWIKYCRCKTIYCGWGAAPGAVRPARALTAAAALVAAAGLAAGLARA